jgi:hypothetical protein
VVRDKGKGEQLVEGATKTGQSRIVDLDAGTVAALRARRVSDQRCRGVLCQDEAHVARVPASRRQGRSRSPRPALAGSRVADVQRLTVDDRDRAAVIGCGGPDGAPAERTGTITLPAVMA